MLGPAVLSTTFESTVSYGSESFVLMLRKWMRRFRLAYMLDEAPDAGSMPFIRRSNNESTLAVVFHSKSLRYARESR